VDETINVNMYYSKLVFILLDMEGCNNLKNSEKIRFLPFSVCLAYIAFQVNAVSVICLIIKKHFANGSSSQSTNRAIH
jgi:hypothetical protein